MMQGTDQKLSRPAHDPARLVLLGASNLYRGLPCIMRSAVAAFGHDLDIRAAIGHGRSYGRSSRFFIRRLPGILECDLWPALDAAPPRRTFALLADIGNDIVYGSSIDTILQWVNAAVDRLDAHHAAIAMTALPMASIAAAPRWQAQLARWIAYPRSGRCVDRAIAAAGELDAALRELAAQRSLPLVEQQVRWYGMDPIHIARVQWPDAAAAMLAPLHNGAPRHPERGSLRRWFRVRTARPSRMHLAGLPVCTGQPSRRFNGGTTLSLY